MTTHVFTLLDFVRTNNQVYQHIVKQTITMHQNAFASSFFGKYIFPRNSKHCPRIPLCIQGGYNLFIIMLTLYMSLLRNAIYSPLS